MAKDLKNENVHFEYNWPKILYEKQAQEARDSRVS